MKRTISVLLLLLLLLSLFPETAFAAEENDISQFEFPSPKAPNYFIYTDGDASEGHHDDLRMIMVTDPRWRCWRQSTMLTARHSMKNTVYGLLRS